MINFYIIIVIDSNETGMRVKTIQGVAIYPLSKKRKHQYQFTKRSLYYIKLLLTERI